MSSRDCLSSEFGVTALGPEAVSLLACATILRADIGNVPIAGLRNKGHVYSSTSMIDHRRMKNRFFSALFFWGLGAGFYCSVNYFQGTRIDISFLVGWTAASIVYAFIAPANKKT